VTPAWSPDGQQLAFAVPVRVHTTYFALTLQVARPRVSHAIPCTNSLLPGVTRNELARCRDGLPYIPCCGQVSRVGG
jgi:hypothetical protein